MNDSVCSTVKQHLYTSGINQEQFAEQLGIHPQYVRDMLNGKVSHVPNRWQQILDHLGLDLIVVPKADGHMSRDEKLKIIDNFTSLFDGTEAIDDLDEALGAFLTDKYEAT